MKELSEALKLIVGYMEYSVNQVGQLIPKDEPSKRIGSVTDLDTSLDALVPVISKIESETQYSFCIYSSNTLVTDAEGYTVFDGMREETIVAGVFKAVVATIELINAGVERYTFAKRMKNGGTAQENGLTHAEVCDRLEELGVMEQYAQDGGEEFKYNLLTMGVGGSMFQAEDGTMFKGTPSKEDKALWLVVMTEGEDED